MGNSPSCNLDKHWSHFVYFQILGIREMSGLEVAFEFSIRVEIVWLYNTNAKIDSARAMGNCQTTVIEWLSPIVQHRSGLWPYAL